MPNSPNGFHTLAMTLSQWPMQVRCFTAAELALGFFSGVWMWLIAVGIYRITLHPLARYPGPFWKKLSDWPLVFGCYNGDRHVREMLDHKTYGPIVRYGPNSLSFSSATALQAIHGPRSNVRKGSWYLSLDISAGAPSIRMVRDKHEHAIRRRFISPAFSEAALKDAEALITQNARKLCDRMKVECSIPDFGGGAEAKRWSAPVNWATWATYYGFDFISDLSFGMSFNMLDNKETRYIPGVLKSASRFVYYVGYLPFIGLVRPLMGSSVQDYIGGQSAKDSLKYTELANRRLADRVRAEKVRKTQADADLTVRKDVFFYLLNSETPDCGRRFTTEELQADSALLIAAGSDGVGLALAAVLFYLLYYPATLERLTGEVRAAFRELSDIRNPTLGSLPYLHACIDEALRLCPPKPSTLPREVLNGGVNIEGHHIPAGITVGVPTYVLHHDETLFPDPWTFRPERWIIDSTTGVTAADISRARSGFLPFLIGPMNCIGKNMAYVAIKLAIAHVLWHFDVRPAGGILTGGGSQDLGVGRKRTNEYQMTDYILGFRDGPLVEFKGRV